MKIVNIALSVILFTAILFHLALAVERDWNRRSVGKIGDLERNNETRINSQN